MHGNGSASTYPNTGYLPYNIKQCNLTAVLYTCISQSGQNNPVWLFWPILHHAEIQLFQQTFANTRSKISKLVTSNKSRFYNWKASRRSGKAWAFVDIRKLMDRCHCERNRWAFSRRCQTMGWRHEGVLWLVWVAERCQFNRRPGGPTERPCRYALIGTWLSCKSISVYAHMLNMGDDCGLWFTAILCVHSNSKWYRC